ncbi:hypothetical protein EG801_15495 [Escherichia coli]|nr:hypothetical protein [Escherichia coli]HAJ0375428.1 hypothetical protein [Escherichia coli]
MTTNNNLINRIDLIMKVTAPLRKKLDSAKKALEVLEPARKQVEALTSSNKNEKTKSNLWYFENEILEYSEPTDQRVLHFLITKLNELKSNKTAANKFFKDCIYIALKRERERSIDDVALHRFISTGEVEAVYFLLNSNISSRESQIIISYLFVYICFIQSYIDYVNEKTNINNDICIIRTNSHYQKLAIDAQKIIIRELNNKRTNYRIAKILKDELSLKYKHVPSENTFKNWIQAIEKYRKERSYKQ